MKGKAAVRRPRPTQRAATRLVPVPRSPPPRSKGAPATALLPCGHVVNDLQADCPSCKDRFAKLEQVCGFAARALAPPTFALEQELVITETTALMSRKDFTRVIELTEWDLPVEEARLRAAALDTSEKQQQPRQQPLRKRHRGGRTHRKSKQGWLRAPRHSRRQSIPSGTLGASAAGANTMTVSLVRSAAGQV